MAILAFGATGQGDRFVIGMPVGMLVVIVGAILLGVALLRRPPAEVPRGVSTASERLIELKRLRDGGMISADEYENQRTKIIAEL